VTTASTCTFTNDRGQELSARLERPDGTPIATALFAHCFTCSKDLRVERQITRALTDQGIAVLSFDFAGLGRSGGDFADATFSCDVADLRAAADHLADTLWAPALLVGHSLGGAAVISAAADIAGVRAVATIAAPADPGHVEHLLDDVERIRDEGSATVTIAGRTFTVRRSFLEDLDHQQPRAQLARFDGALLLFHSPADDLVPIDNAETLYRAAHHPKSFVSLDGADHLVSDQRDAAYLAAVTAAWASRYITDGDLGRGDAAGYDDAAVTATNDSGLRTTISARGFTLVADEPSGAGGTERGPTPYDYVSAGLAACTAMTLRMYASRKDWPLSAVEATVTHDRVHADDCANCEHVEGRIDLFERTLRISGDLDDDQCAKLVEIADKCPVHRTLEGQIEVHTTVVHTATSAPS
jgi:uncharacterized OsmC-like protein/pimeloyl-ACP methyl ester carboxylesterase